MKKHLVFITVFAILTSLFSISAAADIIYDENGTAALSFEKDSSNQVIYSEEETATLSFEKEDVATLMGSSIGEEIVYSGIRYEIISENEAVVVGYTTDIPKKLIIPATITFSEPFSRSFSVQTIAPSAFYNCSAITEVVISEGITIIGESAFSGCTSIKTVTIPSTVNFIDAIPFINTTSLEKFIVSGSNEFYSSDSKALICTDTGELIQYPLADAATDYTIPKNVTRICEYAFSQQLYLKSVTLADETEEISENAFYECPALEKVDLKNVAIIASEAFALCPSLKSIVVPKETHRLYASSFRECVSLASIDVEDGNEGSFFSVDGVLYGNAFNEIKELYEPTLILYPPAAERKVFTVANGIKGIGDQAFWDVINLEKITFSESIEFLNFGAITACQKLKEIVTNDNLRYIRSYAFQTNKALEKITLGNNVEVIENDAFYYCSSLKEINIPASLTEIGNNVFGGCTSLQNIIVDDKNSVYSSINGVLYSKDATSLLQYPLGKTDSSFTIPKATVNITAGAFAGCIAIKEFLVEEGNTNYIAIDGVLFTSDSVLHSYPLAKVGNEYVVPSHTLKIGDQAFMRSKLEKVVLNEGLTEIGFRAYAWCSKLKSINIPETVTVIDNMALFSTAIESLVIPDNVCVLRAQAFDYCSVLDHITFLRTAPPEFEWMLCNNDTMLRYVYVPYGTQTAYKETLTGILYPGAMIVEGTKVSLEDAKDMISTIPYSVTQEDYQTVTEAKNSFVRLTEEEKKSISNEEIVKLDSAVEITNPDLLCETNVENNSDSDNSNVTYSDTKVYGLNLASGIEEGNVELNIIPQTVSNGEYAKFDAKYFINGNSQQPKSPLVVEMPITEEIADKRLVVKHYSDSGKFIENITPEISNGKLVFRTSSLSTFVLKDAETEFKPNGTSVTVFSAENKNAIFCVTGLGKDGKLLDMAIRIGAFGPDNDETLSLKNDISYDKINAFFIDSSNLNPIITKYEKELH